MADKSSPAVELALAECRRSVKKGIHVASPLDPCADVHAFLDLFRHDFELAIGDSFEKWAHDKPHVTALAAAIGATASFMAISAADPTASMPRLMAAYRALKPYCEPIVRGTADNVRGRYCTGV